MALFSFMNFYIGSFQKLDHDNETDISPIICYYSDFNFTNEKLVD